MGRADTSSIQTRFWTRQGISLLSAVVLILGILSIWFNDPTRLSTAFGLVSAGLAFAPAAGRDLGRRLFRRAARQHLHGGRPHRDGRRARRRPAARLHPDDHHGDGSAERRLRRCLDVGAQPAVHRPHRHGVELQDLRRTGVQLHAGLPLHLGGDDHPDHLYRRPRQGGGDHAGGDAQARRRPRFRGRRGQARTCSSASASSRSSWRRASSTASPTIGWSSRSASWCARTRSAARRTRSAAT